LLQEQASAAEKRGYEAQNTWDENEGEKYAMIG
jgi:hypothetical protein